MRRSLVRSLAAAPRSLACIAAAAGLALLVACADASPGDTTGGDGKVRVLLTDAPFPYDSVESVNLFVESVAAATSADTARPGEQERAWATIAEPMRAYDLLDLQSGTTALLGEATLPAGQYRAVRLVIDTEKSSVIDKSGQPMEVLWQTSGGRVALHAVVEDAVDAAAGGSVVIDIDVGRSFVCPGETCGRTLVFIPWFRAVNTAATGSIAGTVRSDSGANVGQPVANATVSVLGNAGAGSADHVVATGATDAAGRYRVPFLRPGSYEVRVDPPRGRGLHAGTRDTVQVVVGEETANVDVTLLGRETTGRLLLLANASLTLVAGDTIRFLTYLTDPGPDSASQTGYAATFTSSDPSVLEVTARDARRAVGRGLGPGSATVTATIADGRTGSLLLTVVPPREIASVMLTLPRPTVAAGDTVVAVASALDADGQSLPGRVFAFTVSDTNVVSPRGTYSGMYFVGYAKKAGTATITATAGGGSAEGTVTVQ